MLNTMLSTDDRITTAHRAKLAYVYVRQSSPGQVRHHQESTELQYRLVERAALFGWPRERVHVIDDDLGKSGTSSSNRHGFQALIAEVGLGKAGLVMSLDASRLARNNRDWHQLLELCSLFGVLIADGERLYDPAAYHDRLLLGLSGIMSEAELHQIKIRLHQGERQKAARGELRLPLPAGLIQTRDGNVTFNPDEEVQERLRMVFAKFRELRSAKAVVRYLRRNNLLLPVRPLRGPAPHDVVWRPSDSARVIHILKNPAYAGAYVYVLDAGANMKTFSRMDGAWLGSVDVAVKKARTSVLFESETQAVWEVSKPEAQAHGLELTNDHLVTFAGGIPLRAPDGLLLGAVGVSGGQVAQDYEVAQAAIAAFRV